MARLTRFYAAICLAFFTTTHLYSTAQADSLPMLTTDRERFVGPDHQAIILKGCNLGNDLVLESWMLGGCIKQGAEPYRDEASLMRSFTARFGADRAEQLMKTWRENYITARDFEQIKSFGFNLVRLPFEYRFLQEDAPPFKIKPDGFANIDRVLQLADAAKVYVILDLHGVPGGQSMQDHTGESGQNHFWNSEENYQRTVEIWKALSQHYKDRSIVAAYDLINEPYSDNRTDVRKQLAEVLPRIYQAIRDNGDQHIVFFPGALNGGVGFYGNPHEKKMANVAFTEHYYPGLFGSKTAIETQARTMNQSFPAKQAAMRKIGSPYYVGEFNVVMQEENAPRVMRAFYDSFEKTGWAGTMWSYKLLKPTGGAGPDAWYMVTNAEALPVLDLDSSSYEEFENFFKSYGTMPLAVNQPLKDALTSDHPAPLYLAGADASSNSAAGATGDPSGFSSIDLGDAVSGQTFAAADGSVTVIGGGSDVNGATDSCRFVSQPINGQVDLRATILSFTDTNEWAKAGVMARFGDGPAAPMAMVNVFPGGAVALMTRSSTGGPTAETSAAGGSLPMELRLQIRNGKAIGSYRTVGGNWQTIAESPGLSGSNVRGGLVACAHDDSLLTQVHAILGDSADAALPTNIKPSSERSLLENSSFENAGSAADMADHWNRWGDWINRETGWKPTHSGSSLIGYHHWQIEKGGSSGLWQDAKVTAGTKYEFAIYAQRDEPQGGAHSAKTIELRIESVTPQGELTINRQNFEIAKLPTGDGWARLAVSGTAQSDTMRVLTVIDASDQTPRGGAIKLDDASLAALPDHHFGSSSMTIVGGEKPAAAHASADDETRVPTDAVAYRDLTYRTLDDGTAVKLDLLTPPGDGPFPVVMWIHGGAWSMGDRANYPHMNFLLRHGFAVANIDYRLTQVAPFPAQLDDCSAALDFLHDQAATYRLDPDRIAAAGESAGGHLALLLAMSRSGSAGKTRAAVHAVIEVAGPTDLAALYESHPDLHASVVALLGGPPEHVAALARQASPLAQVRSSNPPTLILHGGQDPLVPIGQSESLVEALRSAGVRVRFHPIPIAGHVGPPFWTTSMQAEYVAFLNEQMQVR